MEFRDFTYKLTNIFQPLAREIEALPTGRIFSFDWEVSDSTEGKKLLVKSESYFNYETPKVLYGESEYFLPIEQPIPDVGNLVLAELIYQHLSRQVDVVYSASQAHILLTAPTIKSILDTVVLGDN